MLESSNRVIVDAIGTETFVGMTDQQKAHLNALLAANGKQVSYLRELIYDEAGSLKEKLITDINQGPQEQISPPKKMIDNYDSLLNQKKTLKTKQNNLMKRLNDLREMQGELLTKRRTLTDRINNTPKVDLEGDKIKLAEAKAELESLKKWDQ